MSRLIVVGTVPDVEQVIVEMLRKCSNDKMLFPAGEDTSQASKHTRRAISIRLLNLLFHPNDISF